MEATDQTPSPRPAPARPAGAQLPGAEPAVPRPAGAEPLTVPLAAIGPTHARVPVADLSVDYSPRTTTVDEDHVNALMEVIDELPPVLVDQHTMTVIDGIHRLEVFRRSGRAEIPATWFTGDSLEARALGIQANIRHGKPLTRSERQTAAMSLLALAPERSDRWLADICGLSHTSVARLRRIFEGAEPNSSSPSRLGRDGRRRPLDPAPGRTQVARAVAEHPSATIRETADIAGVAASTAQRVMAGLRRSGTTASPADGAPTRRLVLTQHPSLGSSPELSEVASWLERTAVTPEDFRTYLEAMPLGRVYEVADECRRRADTWSGLAKSLERRARSNRRNTT